VTSSAYQVSVADWAIPPALALEHVRNDQGDLCLVWSTTLPMVLDDIHAAVTDHEKVCTT
jgi:hypothetical protein